MSTCTNDYQCPGSATCSFGRCSSDFANQYNQAVKITSGVFIGITVGVILLVLSCCGCGIIICVRHKRKKKMLYQNTPRPNNTAPIQMHTGIDHTKYASPQNQQVYTPAPGTAYQPTFAGGYQSGPAGGYQSYPAPAYTTSPPLSDVSPMTPAPAYVHPSGQAVQDRGNPYSIAGGYDVSNVSVNTHTTGMTGTTGDISAMSGTTYTQTQIQAQAQAQSTTYPELSASKEEVAHEMSAHAEKK